MVEETRPRSLSASQLERLQRAVEQHQGAPKRAEGRTPVPQDIYLARLQEDMKKDRELAAANRQENIAHNIKLWQARIEPRWLDARVENLEEKSEARARIMDKVNRWETGEGTNEISMLFAGALGRGKTWSAHAYAFELVRRGLLTNGQIFVCTESMLAAVASSGFKKEERIRQILSPSYRFFLIDDIGRGAFSTPALRGEIWFEILNHIYTRRLAFVGTTNLSPFSNPNATNPEDKVSKLQSWIGSASFERLTHMVGSKGYVPFDAQTPNMRKTKADQWENEYQRRTQGLRR